MTHSVKFSSLGADFPDTNGGYVTFCLTSMVKVDRRVKNLIY